MSCRGERTGGWGIRASSCAYLLVIFCILSGLCTPAAYAQRRLPALELDARSYHLKQDAARDSLVDRFGLSRNTVLDDGGLVRLIGIEGGMPLFQTTLGRAAAETIHANQLWPGALAGYHLDGFGQNIGVWDAGRIRVTHQEFDDGGNGRILIRDNPLLVYNNHATGVAGVIASTGVNAEAQGLAFASTIWAYDSIHDTAEMVAAAAAGLRVSNHSYGILSGWSGTFTMNGVTAPFWIGNSNISESEDYRFGYYSSTSQWWDEIAYSAPYYLPVKAAGNDRGAGPEPGTFHYYWDTTYGYLTSNAVRQKDGGIDGYDSLPGDASLSKNILSVGATPLIPGGYQSPGGVETSYFSVWGPTDDGRIKPDLVAPGERLFTIRSTADDAYRSVASGTSFSAPVVAAGIGLIHQHYDALFGYLGQPMLASTVRALLYHTAFEAGAEGPDYRYGWGLLNVAGAADVLSAHALNPDPFQLQEFRLYQNQQYVFAVESEGTEPLRVTIAWTDPPADVHPPALNDPRSKLVHDVDLRITGPNGQTYMPWILYPENPNLRAGRGDNTRDNAEQIVIPNPEEGYYTITLTHKGNLTQAYQMVSLIATGIVNAGMGMDGDTDQIKNRYEDPDGNGSPFNDDTDGDGIPNYLDSDDDGDGIPTAEECPDPNGDGNPEDACINGSGLPDYLRNDNLPVELASFEAEANPASATIQLGWTTVSELNNAGFYIEHARHNAAFETIGFVEGFGTTHEVQVYQYKVPMPETGVHRFRLKQVDVDGAFEYSPVVEVVVDGPEALRLSDAYPNPFVSDLTFTLNLSERQQVEVSVYDVLGRQVARVHEGWLAGGTSVDLHVEAGSEWPNGVYLIEVQGETLRTTRTVVLQR